MNAVTLYFRASLFILGIDLIACVIWNPSQTEINKTVNIHKDNDDEPDVLHHRPEFFVPYHNTSSSLTTPRLVKAVQKIKEETDRLPWRKFTIRVSNLLTSEIFSQSDPVFHLLEKIAKLTSADRFLLKDSLASQVFQTTRFKLPQNYVPYAKVSYELLQTRSILENAKQVIANMQRASVTSHFTPPTIDLQLFELSALFSEDIFTDTDPPFRLMEKLINMPENVIINLETKLKKMLDNEKFPEQYFSYVQQLRTFARNKTIVNGLMQSISELRRATVKSSTSALGHQQMNKFRRVNKAQKLPPSSVPLFT